MDKQRPGLNTASSGKTVYQVAAWKGFMSPPILSSLIMAVAGMGDAFLYAYLPVQGQHLGLSVFLVGLLLSINRFVRLFFNRWVAYAANHLGIKTVLRAGILIAGVTTLLYGLNPANWLWIVSRVLWGFSYASLRFATYQYAADSNNTSTALGWSRSIQELGPVAAYWFGPLMIAITGEASVFLFLSAFTFCLLGLLPILPEGQTKYQKIKALHFHVPGITEVWIFISAFLVEGFLVVSIADLLSLQGGNGELLAVSAGYISLRRILNILLAPLAGWLCDIFSIRYVFHLSVLFIVFGFVLIFAGIPSAGIIVSFAGSAMNSTIVPLLAIESRQLDKQFDRITHITTSRDIGAAFGTLTGLLLLSAVPYQLLFGGIVIILLIVWLCLRKFINAYE